ncbi:MAG TPA: YdeI/OmpD-associated family protein [Thermoplasmata archaeon]|nr:YdeI/OmpD-associated family protein [Thermoplasmata archaeon]
MKPTYFANPAEFRDWLETNHDRAKELLVGFYKKSSGRPSITWPESVDEALCFGWIDGKRKGIDDVRYTIRFSPRTSGSIWSAINIARVKELERLGRMRPAGLSAFQERDEEKSRIYSYEQRHTAKLDDAQERLFRANKAAWEFFLSRPPGYQQTATYWVVSAKKDETRMRRLARLIDDSEHHRKIAELTSPNEARRK